jgi:hypothetical protein
MAINSIHRITLNKRHCLPPALSKLVVLVHKRATL